MIRSIMHVSFLTDNMDQMIRFYTEVLGFRLTVLTKYRQYLNRDDRPQMKAIAQKDPDRIVNVYLDAGNGQFIELLGASEGLKPHDQWNTSIGYSHFALLVDDINEAYEDFIKKGVTPDTKISKGRSETYQFWITDPDGNRFEVMQYTDKSYQVVGHIDE